jgi:hypothetical protein
MKLHPWLAALLIAAAPTSSFSEIAKKALGPLVLVDATGRTVGRYGGLFLNYQSQSGVLEQVVYATINGTLVALKLSSCYTPSIDVNVTSLCWGSGEVYFGSSDCSGPGMIQNTISVGGPVAEVLRPVRGGPAFVYIASGAWQVRQYNSIRNIDACFAASGQRLLFDTAPPIDLSTMFTERFHIE